MSQPAALVPAQSMARQVAPPPGIFKKELITMTISIPVVVIAGLIVYFAWRYMGLKVWHAIVCLLFGFLLAATAAGPQIHNLIAGFVQWLTKP
jgi:hypothetical protein